MAERLRWDKIDVRIDERLLSGRERLVAFFRWLRRETSAETTFRDSLTERCVVDPMTVDWAAFPLHEAVTAASEEGV